MSSHIVADDFKALKSSATMCEDMKERTIKNLKLILIIRFVPTYCEVSLGEMFSFSSINSFSP